MDMVCFILLVILLAQDKCAIVDIVDQVSKHFIVSETPLPGHLTSRSAPSIDLLRGYWY